MDLKNVFIVILACFILGQGVVWSQDSGTLDAQQPGADIASREAVGSDNGSANFGYDQLRMGVQTSQTSDQSGGAALASSDYVLGPGDVISVTIYGNGGGSVRVPSYSASGDRVPMAADLGGTGVIFNSRLTIAPEGKIFVPPIGEVDAHGLTVSKLQEGLTRELASYYREMKVSVLLVSLRRMQIFVLGQVQQPGIYTISSLTRVSQAVALAGGPTPLASIRQVQVVRAGKIVQVVDLYKFLIEGRKDQNPQLEPGDTIILPISGRTVRIEGEVRRPGIYEFQVGEKLTDLVVMAGGVTPQASLENLKVENIGRPHEVISISAFKLLVDKDPKADRDLRNGDVVTVPAAPKTVTVVGQVQKPGTFLYQPGTLFNYYLGLAGGFAERANGGSITITRWDGSSLKCNRDTPIRAGDTIVIGSLDIKGWRDYLNVAMQGATLFFIIYQVAKK
jgi:protein involved in polysaccharide export with SLBB domain